MVGGVDFAVGERRVKLGDDRRGGVLEAGDALVERLDRLGLFAPGAKRDLGVEGCIGWRQRGELGAVAVPASGDRERDARGKGERTPCLSHASLQGGRC